MAIGKTVEIFNIFNIFIHIPVNIIANRIKLFL